MTEAKKSLGQYFLKNQAAFGVAIDALKITTGETVIEIGAGHGELTTHLLASKAEKIIAIEKDHELANALTGQFLSSQSTFLIKEGDALKLLPEIITELNGAPYSTVGNIPYYITGSLLRILGELAHKPTRAVLMIQKEVAERLCALPPKMTRLTAMTRVWAEPKIIMKLKPTDFDPTPSVESAIITLETLPNVPAGDALTHYFKTAHILFQQPRKMIANNLAVGFSLPKESVTQKIAPLGLTGTERPGNLAVELILKISILFS